MVQGKNSTLAPVPHLLLNFKEIENQSTHVATYHMMQTTSSILGVVVHTRYSVDLFVQGRDQLGLMIIFYQ